MRKLLLATVAVLALVSPVEAAKHKPKPPLPAPTVTITSLPLQFDGTVLYSNVDIGGELKRMIVDTGSTISTVPADFADKMIAEGRAEEGKPFMALLADGTRKQERTLNVYHMIIGSRSLWNQSVSVGESEIYLLGLYQLHDARAAVDTNGLQLIFLSE